MVEGINLQQILSMGSQVEKMQQVQQNQHDVSAKAFEQDMRSNLDEKKIEVPVQEEGSEIKPADDQSRQKSNQQGKEKKQNEEENTPEEEASHGGHINIKV